MAQDIHDIKGILQRLTSAFPDGDTEGHRRYHEQMIERTAEIRRLRIAIAEKTWSGLIFAAILGIATLIWNGIMQRFN